MQSIEFKHAQQQLNTFLEKRLKGEIQNGSLERRAQRLVDKWWQSQTIPVVMGTSGVQITGCILGFDIGQIHVTRWLTKFVRDQHNVLRFNPAAVALGYCNGFQLFMAKVDDEYRLVARSNLMIHQWSKDQLVPPTNSPLFVALERAKMLGYLSLLQEAQ